MLKITIPAREFFDERTNEFINAKETKLSLEHSLVSVAKWESKWHIPFIGSNEKTREQLMDYVRCMTMTQNVDPTCYMGLTNANMAEIEQYLEDTMTAATFKKEKGRGNKGKNITAETIYYWMFQLGIPMECQKWHLNRLMAMIQYASVMNGPQKKMSTKDVMSQNRALNAARMQRMHSKG